MHVIAQGNLRNYWLRHPESHTALVRWNNTVSTSNWYSMQDVTRSYSKAKVLNGERVRFEVLGGSFRLIAAFDFRGQRVFMKFIGTHAEYDAVDVFTVAMF